MDLGAINRLATSLKSQIGKVVVGQETAVDLMLIGLLTEGHLLLEGPPGTAKTLLAQAFAKSMSLEFGRIQFTPDLMPGDVIGTNLFDFRTNQFNLSKGPIFTDLLLADEINRTPPKTQSALLQAMGERMVTIDGSHYPLGSGFLVIATQNPLEQQGTYPLPEAQLDRFLFKHLVDYPGFDEEVEIVSRHGHKTTLPIVEDYHFSALINQENLDAMRAFVRNVELQRNIITYIVNIVRETRETPSIQYGASSRAANMLAAASCAHAVLDGRDYVVPDDVKYLARPVLRHRLVLSPAAEIEGMNSDAVIDQILEQVEAPR